MSLILPDEVYGKNYNNIKSGVFKRIIKTNAQSHMFNLDFLNPSSISLNLTTCFFLSIRACKIIFSYGPYCTLATRYYSICVSGENKNIRYVNWDLLYNYTLFSSLLPQWEIRLVFIECVGKRMNYDLLQKRYSGLPLHAKNTNF